jgi:hypothetical protein
MNITDKEYKELISYAKALCRGNDSIEPADVVNDAVLELMEKGTSFTIVDLRKKIQGLGINARTEAIGMRYNNTDHFGSETDYCCRKCHEVKLIAAFYISTDSRTKFRHIDTVCKDCRNAAKRENYHKKKTTTEYKEQNKKNFHKHIERNRRSWNTYIKKRYLNDKVNLTDAYCIKRLRYKYSKDELLANPELITQYREKKLKQRMSKKVAA